ncbi:MAG: four helix bundle protein [Bacteroidales bacterium]
MENKKIESYKDLIVWQKGIDLVNEIYVLTKMFPKEEMFGLTNQMRRAAVSIPANIAEGWGRDSTKNYIQFIRISRGSLYELETLFVIARDLNYIDETIKTSVTGKIDEIGKMLNKLLQKLDSYIDKN